MELLSLLALNHLSLTPEETEKIASSSHTHRLLSVTPGVGTMKTKAQHVWNITIKILL